MVSAAQFALVLDSSVATVALPQIQRALGFSSSSLPWVMTAFTLALGGLMLAGGWAADAYGARRIFLIGTALFAGASLAAGLAPSRGALVAARAIQGIGGAAMSPAALALMVNLFPTGPRRNWAIALNGTILASGFASGVAAGGVLTTYLGWRSVFLLEVPVGVAIGLTAVAVLPGGDHVNRARRLRSAGPAVLATVALVLGVYGLLSATASGAGAIPAVPCLLAAASLSAGVRLASRRAGVTLLPDSYRQSRSAAAAGTIALLTAGNVNGVTVLSTLYLQTSLRFTPLASAEVLLLPAAAAATASRWVPLMVARYRSRGCLVLGLATQGVGTLLLFLFAFAGGIGIAIGALALVQIGYVLTLVTATIVVFASSCESSRGSTAGVLNAGVEVGAALGLVALVAAASCVSHSPAPAGVSSVQTVSQHAFAAALLVGGALSGVALFLTRLA